MSNPIEPSDGDPVLPTTTAEDRPESWGDRSEETDSDEERYLRERPPHHEG